MSSIAAQHTTLLDALSDALRGCCSTPDGIEPPCAILWTDPKGQWKPLIPALRLQMPELLTLGEFAPDERTGPAIWLRCMLDEALDEPAIPADKPPVLYLPDVARQDLRAGEHGDSRLRPLIELMFRGTLWLQKGGRDWLVSSFVTSGEALGMNMAPDQATGEALLRALPEFASSPLSQFTGRRLESDDFDKLLTGDVVRDLLQWMDDPDSACKRMGDQGWAAFCNLCQDGFNFNPESQSINDAAEQMGMGEGAWASVWERYVEAPSGYRGLVDLLRRSKPNVLMLDRSRWPEFNDEDEVSVRAALGGISKLDHDGACAKVIELDREHAERRRWVWARLGLSPMAQLLAPLKVLAEHVRSSIGGATPDEIARTYIERGWQADQAAWHVIAKASSADETLMRGVVQHLLEPWLEQSAQAFQRAVEQHALPYHDDAEVVKVGAGECLLFADGLRYDLGELLRERLEALGCRVKLGYRWSALPSVTATAKPAVTPVAGSISGKGLPADFTPSISESNKPANAPNVRELLSEAGYQLLSGSMGDWPETTQSRGWTEAGKIDTRGHQLQAELVGQLAAEVDKIAERIIALLDAGWTAVRIVTDHGWLLLPKGLPKIDLPKHLTESKWARCASVSGDSQVSVPRARWHWNTAQYFATAPGIGCFTVSNCYAHGGISIQECLTPDLHVERTGDRAHRATITGVTWKGMRCFIVGEAGGEVRVDLRLKSASGQSVAAAVKVLDVDGTASLLLADDEYETTDLVVVLLDGDDTVLAQHKTKVGVDS